MSATQGYLDPSVTGTVAAHGKYIEKIYKEVTNDQKTCSFIKKRLRHSYFLVNFAKILRKPFFCFNKSPLKIMKNAFYFMLKALFVLKIFKSLS